MKTYRIYDTNAGYLHFEDKATDANAAVRAFIEDVIGVNTVIDLLQIRVVEIMADGSEVPVSFDADQI